MKNLILKELKIMFIVTIATIIILFIYFYDYNPNKRIIPISEKYEVPETILQEIENAENQDFTINPVDVTKELSKEDLNTYIEQKDYNEGKANPFAN